MKNNQPTITIVPRHQYKPTSGTDFLDKSKTQQHYKDECDVCKQIERLTRYVDTTGMSISDYNSKGAMYGDLSEIPDFLTYQTKVAEAKTKFEMLPNSVRERFNNSPEELFSFVLDKNNYNEAVELGLIEKQITEDIKSDIKTDIPDIKEPVTESSDT